MSVLAIVEGARNALAAGQISLDEAVSRVRSVLNVTDLGATDLLQHPVTPTQRYQAVMDAVDDLCGGAS